MSKSFIQFGYRYYSMKSVYKVRKVSGSLTITIPHESGFRVGDYIKVEG